MSVTPIKFRAGMGLVEVMVAASVIAASVLGGLGAAEYYARSSVSQAQDQALLRLFRGIELILSNPSTCDANLKGQDVGSSGRFSLSELSVSGSVAGSVASPFVRVVTHQQGSQPANAFPLGASGSRAIWVTGLDFNRVGQVATIQRYEFNISVQMPSGAGMIRTLNPATATRTLQVYLEVNPSNRVNRCVTPSASGAAAPPTTAQSACEALGGQWVRDPSPSALGEWCILSRVVCHGWNLRYDPVSRHCNMDDVYKAGGLAMIATGPCSEGQSLRSLAPDGTPLCDSPRNPQPPVVGKDALGLEPTVTANCGDCWMDSAVDCYAHNPAIQPPAEPYERRMRFMVFKRGQFHSSTCALGPPPGLNKCDWFEPGTDPWDVPFKGRPCAPSP
jgi:hypothetical protein